MSEEFIPVVDGVTILVEKWEPILKGLSQEVITNKVNKQGRSIKQIIGHMVDSASNNTHRIVHLQYQESPLQFPNYATNGNNDRWIAIQDYQNENWGELIHLWKCTNFHIAHVIKNVDQSKLNKQWQASDDVFVSLKDMIIDYLRHFELHIREIEELMK